VVKIGFQCRPRFLREAAARGLAIGTLLDRAHPVWVESQVVPDGRHRVVGSLVGPDGVDGALPPDGILKYAQSPL